MLCYSFSLEHLIHKCYSKPEDLARWISRCFVYLFSTVRDIFKPVDLEVRLIDIIIDMTVEVDSYI